MMASAVVVPERRRNCKGVIIARLGEIGYPVEGGPSERPSPFYLNRALRAA